MTRRSTVASSTSIEPHRPALQQGETVIETFVSDITLDGRFASDSSATLTDRRLIVQDPSLPGGCVTLPLEKVERLETLILYGNSLMRAVVIKEDGPKHQELLRFSRSLDDAAEVFVS